jgi:hypothetical protein
MNEHEQERIDKLLKMTLSPIGAGGEPRRDLWPAMLNRLDARAATVPWFDWALLVAAAACLAISPGAIPVLFYHL